MKLDLAVLSLLPDLLEEIRELKHKVDVLTLNVSPNYDLTKRSDILKFLNISESTLSRWLRTGVLKNKYHYEKKIINNKINIIFFPNKIIEFENYRINKK